MTKEQIIEAMEQYDASVGELGGNPLTVTGSSIAQLTYRATLEVAYQLVCLQEVVGPIDEAVRK